MSMFRPLVRALNGNRLVRRAKNVRNEIVDRSFRASGHGERQRFLRTFTPASDIVVFSIAYNTPWVVDILTTAWRKFVRDADLVIVDNSSDAAARREHRRLCEQRGFAYLALPKNREWSPLRSNAIAMNWVFHNIVARLAAPVRCFGFIDHDCFPIADVSFTQLMQGKAAYGLKRVSDKAVGPWYLWAGFCFFQPRLIASKRFDFKHSYEHGMDTGGNNWWPVYATLPDELWADAGVRAHSFESQGLRLFTQIIGGTFSHIGGASYRDDLPKEQIRSAYQDYARGLLAD